MNGLSFSYQGSVYNFPKIYGEFLAPLCFVCVLCSQEFGIPEDKIQSSIRSIQFPAGRGTLLKGKNQSIIIDSSYNANPDTFIALINEVNRWKYEKGPRIIVLGSMNELGKNNTTAHQTVAQQAAHKFDHYICIGHGATIYKKTLMHQGINESQIEVFHSSKDAGNIWIEKCKDMNYTNALFVVKGSQNQVWTERFIPPLLQNKEDISLLARDIPNT
ncbi:MAG: cyanophycin synthetase [Patescibacteria group bacterium]|nr:cyanophycin synthetase [Patescibacteria group bacterium]